MNKLQNITIDEIRKLINLAKSEHHKINQSLVTLRGAIGSYRMEEGKDSPTISQIHVDLGRISCSNADDELDKAIKWLDALGEIE